jgi:hypothetical protein
MQCSFTYISPVPKGVIWLLLAATAEVPPTVAFARFDFLYYYYSPPLQVFLILNLNGSFFLSPPLPKGVDQTVSYRLYQTRSTLCVFVCDKYASSSWNLMSFYDADVPNSCTDHNVNRSNTDVSLFV